MASAAELSCLEISSRTAKSRETWSIIIKVLSKSLSIDKPHQHLLQGGSSLYSGPAVRWRRESPGTVVCIRDAFYNVCAVSSLKSDGTENLCVASCSSTLPSTCRADSRTHTSRHRDPCPRFSQCCIYIRGYQQRTASWTF